MRLRRGLSDFWSRSANGCNAAFGYAAPVLRADDRPADANFAPMWLGPYMAAKGAGLHGSGEWPVASVAECAARQTVSDPRARIRPEPEPPAGGFSTGQAGFWWWCRAATVCGPVPSAPPSDMVGPSSRGQLRKLLVDHGFTPVEAKTMLFMPPPALGLFLRFGPQIERIGRNWSPGVGGVLVVEAEKNLYAPAGKTSRQRIAGSARKLAPRPTSAMRAGAIREGRSTDASANDFSGMSGGHD